MRCAEFGQFPKPLQEAEKRDPPEEQEDSRGNMSKLAFSSGSGLESQSKSLYGLHTYCCLMWMLNSSSIYHTGCVHKILKSKSRKEGKAVVFMPSLPVFLSFRPPATRCMRHSVILWGNSRKKHVNRLFLGQGQVLPLCCRRWRNFFLHIWGISPICSSCQMSCCWPNFSHCIGWQGAAYFAITIYSNG